LPATAPTSRRFVHGHNAGRPKPGVRIEDRGYTTPCYISLGFISASTGYAYTGTGQLRHRAVYEQTFGKIAAGMTIDHLCRQPACLRLDHLEMVTQRENTLRGLGPAAKNAKKTACVAGHSLADAYLIAGRRVCRECTKRRNRERIERRNARLGQATPGRRPWIGTGRCKRGHPLTPDNVYLRQSGAVCRTCVIARAAERARTLKAR
jgi:hypothetical protein